MAENGVLTLTHTACSVTNVAKRPPCPRCGLLKSDQETDMEMTVANSAAGQTPAASPPLEMWIVVGRLGNISCADNEQHARAKAICNNNEYPSLAPHRVLRMLEAR